MKEKKYDIEERLIDFGVDVLIFIKNLPKTKSSSHYRRTTVEVRDLSLIKFW